MQGSGPVALSIDIIPNRSSPPAILRREGRRIRRRTLANLSKMLPALAGGVTFASPDAVVTIRRALPHGHVAAVLGMVRTSLDADAIGPAAAVEAYKSLAQVARAFRNAKSDLRVRPVHVHTPDHVKAHVFLCMLAIHPAAMPSRCAHSRHPCRQGPSTS